MNTLNITNLRETKPFLTNPYFTADNEIINYIFYPNEINDNSMLAFLKDSLYLSLKYMKKVTTIVFTKTPMDDYDRELIGPNNKKYLFKVRSTLNFDEDEILKKLKEKLKNEKTFDEIDQLELSFLPIMNLARQKELLYEAAKLIIGIKNLNRFTVDFLISNQIAYAKEVLNYLEYRDYKKIYTDNFISIRRFERIEEKSRKIL